MTWKSARKGAIDLDAAAVNQGSQIERASTMNTTNIWTVSRAWITGSAMEPRNGRVLGFFNTNGRKRTCE